MPVPQQKFREIVFQALYSYDIARASEEDILELLMNELSVTRKVVKEAQERVSKILEKKEDIDALIAKASLSYEFARIQTVERNILRLGVFELLFDDSIPPRVAITEGMRLARKFGTPESASFVNAVLDNLYKSNLGEKVDPVQIDLSVQSLLKSEELAREASQNPPKQTEE